MEECGDGLDSVSVEKFRGGMVGSRKRDSHYDLWVGV